MKILMKSNKLLVITEHTKIWQKESAVDTLLFFMPTQYQDIDLSRFTFTLTYLDPQGGRHTEMLTADTELYKENYLVFRVPVDSEITNYHGTITLSLSGVWVDSETMKQYSIKTSSLQIEISPLSTLYEFIPDESLDTISQKMMELNAKIQAVEKIEDMLDKEIPDDLVLDTDNKVHLSIDGDAIGDGVAVVSAAEDTDENNDGMIDLETATGSGIPVSEGIAIIDL